MKVLTQIWRVVRIFALAFVAQLIPSFSLSQVTKQALIAAGVAGVEALYRQFVPAGKTDGILGNLIAAYNLIKQAGAPAVQPVAMGPVPAPVPVPVAPAVTASAAFVPAVPVVADGTAV